jgi:WD40 repeat protein
VDDWAEVWRREAPNVCASLEFSPDGSLLASGINAMGKNEHIIVTLVRAEDGRLEAGVVDFYNATDLAFSPDGQTLLAVAYGEALLYHTTAMRRFVGNALDDVGTDRPAGTLHSQGETDRMVVAEFSPSQPLVGISTSEGNLLLWPTEDALPSVSLSTSDTCYQDPPDRGGAIAFSRDGTVIATNLCAHGLALFDARTLAQMAAIPVPGPILALAFSPDGSRVLGGHEQGALVWDLQTNSVACELDTHTQSPVAVGFTPDGTRAIAATRQGALIQWDLDDCGHE